MAARFDTAKLYQHAEWSCRMPLQAAVPRPLLPDGMSEERYSHLQSIAQKIGAGCVHLQPVCCFSVPIAMHALQQLQERHNHGIFTWVCSHCYLTAVVLQRLLSV